MFNKNKYRKINDKKILHKIKGHWCVISVALLGMIGGAAMTQANVNADVNPQNNQINHSVSSVSSTQNEPQLVNNQSNHGDSYGVNHDRNVNDVSSQSTNLHNRIIKQGAQTSRYYSTHGSRLLGTSAGASSSSMNASQASMAESSEASSAAASVVARGGHRISVSTSVRSDMISGASEIASYNQITRSNAYATVGYLDSLNNSEKSSAESYVMGFYGNKRARSDMTMDNEAAHDIEIWGEDPDFFTLYQAEPDSIVNNVRTIYEPTASAYAAATGWVAARIKSLDASQMNSSSSSIPTSSNGSKQPSGTVNNTNVTPQSNSQALVGQSPSNYISSSISDNYSSSNVSSNSDNLVHFWDEQPATSNTNSNNNVSNSSNVVQSAAINKSDDSSTDQKTSADSDDSDADDNDQTDSQDSSTNSAGAQSSDPSTNDARWNAKGTSNVNNDQNGQTEQAGIAHDSAPMVNNDPVNATDNVSDNQGSSNGKLPQTNEASSSKGEEMAEISLIMSTTFGALGMYIDKHRHDND